MENLTEIKCSACNSSSVALPANEIATLIKSLPNWQLVSEKVQKENKINEEKNIIVRQKIVCSFNTRYYKRSLALTNAIASLAETENHHPEILLRYSEVSVSWWTHVVDGLHTNDFIMAAKTTALFNAL